MGRLAQILILIISLQAACGAGLLGLKEAFFDHHSPRPFSFGFFGVQEGLDPFYPRAYVNSFRNNYANKDDSSRQTDQSRGREFQGDAGRRQQTTNEDTGRRQQTTVQNGQDYQTQIGTGREYLPPSGPGNQYEQRRNQGVSNSIDDTGRNYNYRQYQTSVDSRGVDSGPRPVQPQREYLPPTGNLGADIGFNQRGGNDQRERGGFDNRGGFDQQRGGFDQRVGFDQRRNFGQNGLQREYLPPNSNVGYNTGGGFDQRRNFGQNGGIQMDYQSPNSGYNTGGGFDQRRNFGQNGEPRKEYLPPNTNSGYNNVGGLQQSSNDRRRGQDVTDQGQTSAFSNVRQPGQIGNRPRPGPSQQSVYEAPRTTTIRGGGGYSYDRPTFVQEPQPPAEPHYPQEPEQPAEPGYPRGPTPPGVPKQPSTPQGPPSSVPAVFGVIQPLPVATLQYPKNTDFDITATLTSSKSYTRTYDAYYDD